MLNSTRTGFFITRWYGSGVSGPSGIAADSDRNVHVSYWNSNAIVKYDSEGNVTDKWEKTGGGSGSGNGEFRRPTDVHVDANDKVYAADVINSSPSNWKYGRVQVFNPNGINVDSLGRIFIVDTGNRRVQIFIPQ